MLLLGSWFLKLINYNVFHNGTNCTFNNNTGFKIDDNHPKTLTAAQHLPIRTLGMINEIPLILEGYEMPVNVHVIKDPDSNSIILGQDFIREYGLRICSRNNTIDFMTEDGLITINPNDGPITFDENEIEDKIIYKINKVSITEDCVDNKDEQLKMLLYMCDHITFEFKGACN